MTLPPEPDWDRLPDELPSTTVAQIVGLSPRSLNVYVRRGQLAAPVSGSPNSRNYRRQDVRTFYELRRARSFQYYEVGDGTSPPIPLKPAETAADEPLSLGVSAPPADLAGAMNELLPRLQSALTEAVQEGIREGAKEATAPLVEELRALRQEMAALREVADRREQEREKLPWWRRIFGG